MGWSDSDMLSPTPTGRRAPNVAFPVPCCYLPCVVKTPKLHLSRPLPRSFYARSPLEVAPELLGKILVTQLGDGGRAVLRIVEVEAYLGQSDPASHAYRGCRGRAALMYGLPGKLYVYFTYGMHFCMNAVAHEPGDAGAVLLRAAEPLAGIAQMQANRGRERPPHALARGPACLTSALGVARQENGADLIRGPVRLHHPAEETDYPVAAGPRIGIRHAADKPWRFFIPGHPSLSGSAKHNHIR